MIKKEQIIKWLEYDKLQPEEVGEVPEGVKWVLRGVLRDIPFSVFSSKDGKTIILQRLLDFQDEISPLLQKLSLRDREKFTYQLKKSFLLSHIRYNMKFDENDNSVLTRLKLEDRIFEEALNINTFYDKLFKLHDSTIFVLITIKQLQNF